MTLCASIEREETQWRGRDGLSRKYTKQASLLMIRYERADEIGRLPNKIKTYGTVTLAWRKEGRRISQRYERGERRRCLERCVRAHSPVGRMLYLPFILFPSLHLAPLVPPSLLRMRRHIPAVTIKKFFLAFSSLLSPLLGICFTGQKERILLLGKEEKLKRKEEGRVGLAWEQDHPQWTELRFPFFFFFPF